MKAVIYARFSSHNQREESIDGQLRECNEFASNNKIEVIGNYIDRAISAKTDNRPEFQRMIRDSYAHQWDAIIVYELDRFARNRYDSAIYKAKLKKNGVRVMSAKERITNNPDDPTSIIMESLLEGMAEYYSAELAQKVMRGMEQNALESRGTGGTLPLGYRMTPDHHFEIDPVNAAVVREIFSDYANGKTKAEIIRSLNQQGARTSFGRPFGYNSFSSLLHNEKYIGMYKFGSITIPNGIPAIVEMDIFDKVQWRLKKNKSAPARNKATVDYLLTGKLFCGKCSGSMVGESGRSHCGGKYYYYKCKNTKHIHSCDAHPIRKEWIESAVVSETIQNVLTDEMIDVISKNAVDLQNREQDKRILNGLKRKLKEKEKAIANLVNAIESGAYSPSIQERLSALEKEKDGIEANIAIEQIEKPFITSEQVRFYLEHFRHGDINDIAYCRDIIDVFVRAVYVFDDKYCITYYYTNDPAHQAPPNGSDLKYHAPPIKRILGNAEGPFYESCNSRTRRGAVMNDAPVAR